MMLLLSFPLSKRSVVAVVAVVAIMSFWYLLIWWDVFYRSTYVVEGIEREFDIDSNADNNENNNQ